MSHHDALYKLAPHASPCSRWNFAVTISEGPEPDINTPYDQITNDATAYLLSKDKKKFPDIFEAYNIFQDDETERAMIEARILAGQTVEEIAGYSYHLPRVLRVYEALFFSVRERAIPFERLLQYTVGECLITGFKNHHIRQLWAWLAIHGSTDLVEEAIYTMVREDIEYDITTPTLSLYLRPDSFAPDDLQTMIAECVTPFFNPQIDWIRAFARYYQQLREFPTSKELSGLSLYKQARINFAYLVLTKGLSVNQF